MCCRPYCPLSLPLLLFLSSLLKENDLCEFMTLDSGCLLFIVCSKTAEHKLDNN